jgi:hypothetical protein
VKACIGPLKGTVPAPEHLRFAVEFIESGSIDACAKRNDPNLALSLLVVSGLNVKLTFADLFTSKLIYGGGYLARSPLASNVGMQSVIPGELFVGEIRLILLAKKGAEFLARPGIAEGLLVLFSGCTTLGKSRDEVFFGNRLDFLRDGVFVPLAHRVGDSAIEHIR